MDAPARQDRLRGHNLALALQVVSDGPGPVSRAGIATRTGLTRATASTLADALLVAGLVREVPLPPTARSGRPATGIELSPDGPVGLGLAVHVDHLAVVVVGLDGAVRAREVVPGDQRGTRPRDVLHVAAAVAGRLVERVGLEVCGATVAVPGLVDPDGRRLLRAPNLGWGDVPVLALLAAEPALAGLPLRLDNEADLAALAEMRFCLGDVVYLSGEVGIGAGVVLGGRLHRGGRGWSGEIGHLTVDRRGPVCSCGARGCLEQYAGQEAVLRRAGLATAVAPGQGDDPAVRRLVELAGEGCPRVLRALDGAGQALGVVLAGVVNLLDLDEVVLGGTLALLAPWLVPPIEAQLADHVLWSALQLPVVRAARSGPDAVVTGAALSALDVVRSDPAGWAAGERLRRPGPIRSGPVTGGP